jgi:hypothetical protein
VGAWDVRIFDSDTAGDWAYGLEGQSDTSLVSSTLSAVLAVGDAYLDSDVACEGLAAAEVVARLRGNWGQRNPYTETVDQWVESHPAVPSRELIAQATAAIDRILSEPSELLELWSESDELERWRTVVQDLRLLLQAGSDRATEPRRSGSDCSRISGLWGGASARADSGQLQFLFDTDLSTATGCTVSTPEGNFVGAELRLIATVDLDAATVGSLQLATCSAGVFGAPESIDAPFAGPWGIALDNGEAGSDLFEAYVPLDRFGAATLARVGVVLSDDCGSDALIAGPTGSMLIDLSVPMVAGAWRRRSRALGRRATRPAHDRPAPAWRRVRSDARVDADGREPGRRVVRRGRADQLGSARSARKRRG